MIKRPKFRTPAAMAIAAPTVIAAASLTDVAGPAEAAPPRPQLARLTTTGNDFGLFGDRAYCHGTVNVGLTSARPGVVRLTLTSHGFTGSGPAWARDPHCGVLFVATHTSANAFMKETFIPATMRSSAGQQITRDIATGSGVVEFSVVPYAKRGPLRALQGYGYGAYVVVP